MGIFAPETRAALSDANVNLYSGVAMLVFGCSCCDGVAASRRAS